MNKPTPKSEKPPAGPADANEHDSAPVDDAGGAKAGDDGAGAATRPDPTRYGDWEKNGRCIDF